MTLSIIVAVAENGVIGSKNRMPWHLPEDLGVFKRRTMGHSIIMGRKTFESIGHALPGRRNIVLSRSSIRLPEGVELAHSMEEALGKTSSDGEVFVIGGAELYRQALPIAERIYLSRIKGSYQGDTLFPELPPGEWEVSEQESYSTFKVDILQRVSGRDQPTP